MARPGGWRRDAWDASHMTSLQTDTDSGFEEASSQSHSFKILCFACLFTRAM
jgi:hypothetical protein